MDQLKFLEGFVREAEEERVAVVQAGSDKALNKDGSSVRGEGRAQTVDVVQMEVGSPGNVTDVRLE